jgi:hypothetical protein
MAFERQVVFPDRHPQVALVGSALVRLDDLGREIKRNVCPCGIQALGLQATLAPHFLRSRRVGTQSGIGSPGASR